MIPQFPCEIPIGEFNNDFPANVVNIPFPLELKLKNALLRSEKAVNINIATKRIMIVIYAHM